MSRPSANVDDDKFDETFEDDASTYSNPSSCQTYQDVESIPDETLVRVKEDELENQIDNISNTLHSCMEGLEKKGSKDHEDALKALNSLLSKKFIFYYLIEQRFTLTDLIVHCLKKGKSHSEQLLAAEALAMFFTQFGNSTDGEAYLTDIRETLITFIKDEKLAPELREMCIKAFGAGIFMVSENIADAQDTMGLLESIFVGSYKKGDGSIRILTNELYQLHTTALSVWSLLLSTMSTSYVNSITKKYLSKFQDFLESPSVDLRIEAGETLAMFYEFGLEDDNSEINNYDNTQLVELLKTLAKESGKARSKKEKRTQHSSFRDIQLTIEQGELPEPFKVKFGKEEMEIDSWIKRKHYNSFCEILGTGMNPQLQENEYLREIFELGLPLLASDIDNNKGKLTKMQKTQQNKEQFRYRTKNMNKKRENKAYVHTQGDE